MLPFRITLLHSPFFPELQRSGAVEEALAVVALRVLALRALRVLLLHRLPRGPGEAAQVLACLSGANFVQAVGGQFLARPKPIFASEILIHQRVFNLCTIV